MQIPENIVAPKFMNGTLESFSGKKILNWLEQAKKIDEGLKALEAEGLQITRGESNFVNEETVERLQAHVNSKAIISDIDVATIQVFDGYYVYEYPDGGALKNQLHQNSLWYGVAKVTRIDRPHLHENSDSFNLILEGQGIFYGSSKDIDKFENYYHGSLMYPGAQFFIPSKMTHGHVIKKDTELWFLFVQEIGFREGLEGEGDYHLVEKYSIEELVSQFH